MIDEELQKYFGFDEDELFANRSGVLTDKQRKRLEGNAQFARKLFLGAGIFIFAIAILPSVIFILVKAPTIVLVAWSIIWIPIWSFIGMKVIRMGAPSQADFNLKCTEGQVNIVKESNYNTSTKQRTIGYELHIGGMTFDVDSGLADIMMQGDTYAMYYMEGTKSIMSAEKIR